MKDRTEFFTRYNGVVIHAQGGMVMAMLDLIDLAIGGIDPANAESCFSSGAAGVAVISAVSRAADPFQNALGLSMACGCRPRER